jgi:tetratricopeptide (TPR) repeat protein
LNKSTEDNILIGLDLENEGKIDDAIDYYENLIKTETYVNFALTNLASIRNKYSKPGINDYFEKIISGHDKHYGKVKKLMGDIFLQNDQFDNAIMAYNDVITNSPKDYDGINARFEKLFGYLHIKNNISMAAKILLELKGMNLTDSEQLLRFQIADNFIHGAGSGSNVDIKLQDNLTPTEFSLSQNFPNPFNPVTMIRYQILKPGMVTLKVYDILGREVATLVNGNKIEGTYDISFDASKLTSGIYIYQLIANNYISSKKMILLK